MRRTVFLLTLTCACFLAMAPPAPAETAAGNDETTEPVHGGDLGDIPGLPARPTHDILYAKIDQTLVRVDYIDSPGLSEIIGEIGFGQIHSMDFDPEGNFFAIGRAPGLPGKYLIIIDPVMGTGTRIGGPVQGISPSFASDSNGNLYGADSGSNALYRVNRTTGLSTRIGSFGYSTDHQSMDFSPDNTLYLLTRRITFGGPPMLLRINVGTGRATPIAELRLDRGLGPERLTGRTNSYGLSFGSDGTLYASMVLDGQPQLLTVDPATGIARSLGIMRTASGQQVHTSSIAFGPASWANIPPVPIIKGPSQVEATSWAGAEVTLDGSDSYDPDTNDPLQYAWVTADYGHLYGIDPILTTTLPLGLNPVVLIVWDSDGKGDTETAEVDIVDTTPPALVTPQGITLEGQSYSGVPRTDPAIQALLGAATASDTVDPSPVITNNAPADFPVGATNVTFIARDFSGNTTNGNSPVTVVDTTPPVVHGPSPATVEATSRRGIPTPVAEVQAFLNAATATDICDPAPVITNNAPVSFIPLGQTVVTFTARDASGNTATGQGTLTVVDTTPPNVTPPPDITVEAQGAQGTPAAEAAIQAFLAAATATDLVDPLPVITNDAPGDHFPLGTTVVTFSARDRYGNVGTGQASVNVVDMTPPELTVPAPITVEQQVLQGVPASDPAIQAFLAAATATDAIDPSPAVTNDAPTDFLPLGTTIVTFTARDAAGNEASGQSTITVVDGIPPTLTVPAPITLEGQSPLGVAASDPAILAFLAAATATDAVDPSPDITNDAPADFFPLGTTVVTFTARDDAGNESTDQSSVTVVDTTPPALTVPAPIAIEGQSPEGVPVSDPAIQALLAAATASDICDPAPVVTNDAPAGFCPLGPTVVTFTATDASGNTATGQTTITVVDTTPPALSIPPAVTVEAHNAGGAPATDPAILAFLAAAAATDACDPAPVVTNDAPAGPFPIGTTTVTFTARDAAGNTATGQSTITVVDTTPPAITVPAPITLEGLSPSGVPATHPAIQAFLAAASATDTVDPSPVLTNNAPANTYPMGTTVVTFTARDATGNTATAQSTVTVVDTTPPTIIGPDSIVLITHGPQGVPASEPTLAAFLAGASATDICDPSPVITHDASSGYCPLGVTVVTFTARDASGNTATVQATVEVVNFPPVVGPIHAPVAPIAIDTEMSAWSPFSDQAVLLTHTAEWNWGDGVLSPGTVLEEDGAGTVTGTHIYRSQGVYTLNLKVTDNCGLSGTANYRYVVVYDSRDGGFITGGGWIDSPAGAAPGAPSVTGSANFGFVSKYKKGAALPTGQVEFNFKEADLNFHSSTHQWLIMEGLGAKCMGTGTVNGEGQYSFMITIIDADLNPEGEAGPDGFRMKIWEPYTNKVIYDSKMGVSDESYDVNPLVGGNVVIHQGR